MKTRNEGSIDQLSIDTIRLLSADIVQKANSGHPGLPLGAAPMAYVLWSRFLKFNPKDPDWINRDRFVLSPGHGSALLYSLLHLYGYDLPAFELERFRQIGSKTPGHPESFITSGVEVTTGPLGQGFGNGVGMAITEAFISAQYNQNGNRIIDYFTFGIVSDGDLMEGISSEAASLAGHLKLGKLIYLYDDNNISLDGPTNLSFTENVQARFEAYGWHTITVSDGNDTEAIERAIASAKAETTRPSLISVKTIIGFGSPLQGTNKVHGNPLGAENLNQTKINLGWDPQRSFFIPDSVRSHLSQAGEKGELLQREWNHAFSNLSRTYPNLAENLKASFEGRLPMAWEMGFPTFTTGTEMSTREASGQVLNVLKKNIPWLIGGSADLASSNETPGTTTESFQAGRHDKRNIWFGVREHAMGAILNGMAASGGVRVYGATFLTFSDYMRGSIRLASLSKHPVTYIFTHDSIAVGEDGPTHQPVEHITALRTIPNLTVIRPADAHETMEAWKFAINHLSGPVALILSRQKLPILDQKKYGSATNLSKGGYILSDSQGAPKLIIIATGSEVKLALQAQERLLQDGISVRVVSLPSFELFQAQSGEYRDEVLPPSQQVRLAIEAGVTMPWYKYISDQGEVIGIDRFGESGDGESVLNYFGFTAENVYVTAKRILTRANQ